MLWVLKRTVSMRCSFEHPKHMLKLTGKKIYTFLRRNCLSKPVVDPYEILQNVTIYLGLYCILFLGKLEHPAQKYNVDHVVRKPNFVAHDQQM